jgi:hypothetical protein
MRMCVCASGCDHHPLADPGVFGPGCSCWCHQRFVIIDTGTGDQLTEPMAAWTVSRRAEALEAAGQYTPALRIVPAQVTS